MAELTIQQIAGTASQCAKRYGVHRATFYRWMDDPGAPKPIVRNGISRWYFAEADEFLRSSRGGPQSRRA